MSLVNATQRGASRPVKMMIISLCLLAVGILVGTAVLEQKVSQQVVFVEGDPGGVLIGLAFVLLAVVGALAAMGQPRNAVGWVLLGSGLSIGLSGFGSTVALFVRELQHDPARAIIGDWLAGLGWYAGLLLLIVIFPYLFPNGRLPVGRFWRLVFAIASIFFTGVLSFQLLGGLALIVLGATIEEMERSQQILESTFIIVLPLLLLGVISQAVRFHQAHNDTRQQLKWLLLTLGTTFTAFLILGSMEDLGFAEFSNLIWGMLYLLIPTGLGIALLRYRMFDVDAIIRRGTAYVILTVLLALVYFGTVILLQSLVGRTAAEQSPLVIVISTLLIAALFTPLRSRVQSLIDRRFYRKKYDAQQVLAQFAQTAQNEISLEELESELLRVVQETMQPDTAILWLRDL
jgi:MFS family permease